MPFCKINGMLGQALIQILLTKPSFVQWAYYTSLAWFKGQHEKTPFMNVEININIQVI